MKGLLLKDLFSLRRSFRTSLVILLFYVVFALTMHSVTFISTMSMLFFTMLSITSFAYDEQAKWGPYAASLPVTRNQIVLSKYILALLLALIGAVVSIIGSFAAPLIGDESGLSERMLTVLAMFLISILFASVMLPLTYKFGTEKSRLMIIAVFAVPGLIVYFLGTAGIKMPDEAVIEKYAYMFPIFVLAAAYISYLISCRVFSRKEL
jgi:hypothetical protein